MTTPMMMANADARGNSDEGLLTLFVTSDAPLNVSLVVQILAHGWMDEDKKVGGVWSK